LTLSEVPTPFRLGFLLEQVEVDWSHRLKHRPYRGVERLYFVRSPEGTSGRSVEDSLWDKYFEAKDTGDLHHNLSLARSLRDSFDRLGLRLEVVYVEITDIPPPSLATRPDIDWAYLVKWLKWRTPFHERLAGYAPDAQSLLGYDLSTPFPTFHSVICEPDLSDADYAKVHSTLNDNGLVRSHSDAVNLLKITSDYQHFKLPFCVMAIHEVKAQGQ
jgi:hypothetical protein